MKQTEETKNQSFEFCIYGLTPKSLSLDRFVSYIKELKKIFGEKSKKIQFDKVEKGSAGLKIKTQEDIDIDEDVKKYDIENSKMQKLLEEDKSYASLKTPKAKVYEFPGINKQKNKQQIILKSVKRDTTGKIISISGKDKTVQIDLLSGKIEYPCRCSEEIAGQLRWGMYISAVTVGDWIQSGNKWYIPPRKRLEIQNFKILEEKSFQDIFKNSSEILSNETYEKIQKHIKDSRGY